ncbi:MAG TPA: DNA primase, partial [Thermopolyspora sp.]
QAPAAAKPRPPRRVTDLSDPAVRVELEALKLAVQRPVLMGPEFDALGTATFNVPEHAAVYELIMAAGGTAGCGTGGREWVDRLLAATSDEAMRATVTRLAVEAIRTDVENEERYGDATLASLEEIAVTRALVQVKARMQRLNPVEEQQEYNRLFGELAALEQQRRVLRERATGMN